MDAALLRLISTGNRLISIGRINQRAAVGWVKCNRRKNIIKLLKINLDTNWRLFASQLQFGWLCNGKVRQPQLVNSFIWVLRADGHVWMGIVVGLAAVIKIMEILYKTRSWSNHKNSPKTFTYYEYYNFCIFYSNFACGYATCNNNWITHNAFIQICIYIYENVTLYKYQQKVGVAAL